MRSIKTVVVTWVAVATATALWAAEPQRLTVETIFSDEFRDSVSVPSHAWLDDGSLLLFDKRLPEGERGLERLDPATGNRRPACDRVRALASLAALAGNTASAPKVLEWPDVLLPNGSVALYLLEGDLFLLDLRSSAFRRVTLTVGKEKCPSLSPDGTRAAFVRDNDLYVVDLATGRERRLTRDGGDSRLNGTLSWVYWEEIFGRKDTGYWWSPDSQAIAFLQSDESDVGVSVFPEFEPATPNVIRQRYAKAGEANPRVRLGLVEVGSGSPRWADLGTPAPEYIMRVAWLPDSREVAVQVEDRAQKKLELVFVDRHRGRSRSILTETAGTSVNPSDDLHFLDGGKRFLWSSERDGFLHLYLYGADGSLIRPLTPGLLMLRNSSDDDLVNGAVVAVDEANRSVHFTATDELPLATGLYRVGWEGGSVERVSREDGTHRVSMRRDGAFYIDRFGSFGRPPGLYLYRPDGSRAATITPPATEIVARYGLQAPEFVLVPAEDGFAVPAQISKPRDFDPTKRYPVILSVYGGPGAPQVWNDWQRDVYFDNVLLEAGFVCMTVDPRSASGLSRTLEDTSYGKMFSAYEVPDILSAVRLLSSLPWVDPQRVGVWGWSGGGTTTLQLMTHSKAFKAGIAVAAVTDFRYYDTVWTEGRLGLPKANPEGYRAAAPANFARDLSGKLLLIHGTYDDNVHPQNSWRFARELQLAGTPFEMMVYPLEKHGLRGVNRHVYETMLEFWKRNL